MHRRADMEQEREDASIAIRKLENFSLYEEDKLKMLHYGLIAIARTLYFIAIILYKRLK